VSSVVAAEATRSNGILETNEVLKITWAASGPNVIASQSMTVDGKTIAPINGPYSGLYYSCPIGTWTAGTHNYTIHATDALGVSFSSAGSFIVANPAPPVISAVVVAEAVRSNGILESNEALKITWAASCAAGVGSQTMVVDGKTVAPINGPYSSVYYSCPIGTRAAGSHSYTIRTTDAKGAASMTSGTFTVAAALMVDASTAPQDSAAMLSDAQLAPIAAEAIRRLESQLGSQVETTLAGATIKIANLSTGILGETAGNTIWIDDNAAGYGWFVDPTPGDDAEFAPVAAAELAAQPGSAAGNRADLLTTVMHEMGHLLGYQHTADDLMQALLPLGVRRNLAD
jgi:hypothetical protein